MFRRRKMGAAGIFIILICTTLIGACTIIGNAAFDKLKVAATDAAINLSARSVLSEYDKRLKNDYQIFAYKGNDSQVSNLLENYIELNLNGSFKPLNAGAVSVETRNTEFVITEPEVMAEQLVEAGRICAAGKSYLTRRDEAAEPSHELENSAMLHSLPSQGKNIKVINVAGLDANRALTDTVSESYLMDKYIMNTFENRFEVSKTRYAFYDYEVEYIISGKASEKDNLKYVKGRIVAIREAFNTAHILADPKKMAEIEAYIAGLPPPANQIGVMVIVAAWATAESINDANRLLDGKKVPLQKTRSEWALTLENALKAKEDTNYIEPSITDKGIEYGDYLSMLLYIEDRNTKLVRIMDLIQINLRASYNGNLLLKEFFTGFEMEAWVDGKEYEYVHTY